MIIRSLDTLGDWTFGKGKTNYLSNNLAIAENILTRLYSFLNDAFWDTGAGIDWTRLLGTPGTKAEILLSCRAVILQSYGVTAVNSISSVYSETNRNLVLSFNINTKFTSQFSMTLQLNLAQILGG
jgi:hypothetical protein